MKGKLVKFLSVTVLTVMMIIPCGVKAQAEEIPGASESVPITETKSSSSKVIENLEKIKAQIAGLLNIDIGQIEKIIVSTTDKVNVILKDSNINIDIDIDLINIIINKK